MTRFMQSWRHKQRSNVLALPELTVLRALPTDVRWLFLARAVRLFAYGALSVVLALYLSKLGFGSAQIGWLLTLTLMGDAVISLVIASVADRLGRRKMLMLGAALMVLAGVVFTLSGNPLLLTMAAIIGVLSPTGAEVGPFLALEQAALSGVVAAKQRTAILGWYNLFASAATALGALSGGLVAQALGENLSAYRAVILLYAALGIVLLWVFGRVSSSIEVNKPSFSNPLSFGLERSKHTVFRLSALFVLDSFAGGLVVQSLVAYWLSARFGTSAASLGILFFSASLLSALSQLAAARVAARFGLINTMVWTHIPANLFLCAIPLMPTLPLAALMVLLRASLSQMDVPTRQSYVMAVVDEGERSAAAGFTNLARTFGTMLAPAIAGPLVGSVSALPFLMAGGLKIVYDLLLYASFRRLKPKEEL